MNGELEMWFMDSSFIPLPSRESSYASTSPQTCQQKGKEADTRLSGEEEEDSNSCYFTVLASSLCQLHGASSSSNIPLRRRPEDIHNDVLTSCALPQKSSSDHLDSNNNNNKKQQCSAPNSSSGVGGGTTTSNKHEEDMTKMLSFKLLSCSCSILRHTSKESTPPCSNYEMSSPQHSSCCPASPSPRPQELSAVELLMRSRLLTIDNDQQERQRSSQHSDVNGGQRNCSLLKDPQFENNSEIYPYENHSSPKAYHEDFGERIKSIRPEEFQSIKRNSISFLLDLAPNKEPPIMRRKLNEEWDPILFTGEEFAFTSNSLEGNDTTEIDTPLSSSPETSQAMTTASRERSFMTCVDDENEQNATDLPNTPRNVTSVGNNPPSNTVKRFKAFHEDKWNDHFKGLRQYKATHGDCFVPHTYSQNPLLARWVKRQRRQFKLYLENDPSSTMTPERIDQLNDEGFVWDSHDATWMTKYNMLVEFRKQNGHCCVPSSSNKSSYSPLATWVKCQRRLFRIKNAGKKSAMSDERVDLLNSIGFAWEVR